LGTALGSALGAAIAPPPPEPEPAKQQTPFDGFNVAQFNQLLTMLVDGLNAAFGMGLTPATLRTKVFDKFAKVGRSDLTQRFGAAGDWEAPSIPGGHF
jgi:hypothetical protein